MDVAFVLSSGFLLQCHLMSDVLQVQSLYIGEAIFFYSVHLHCVLWGERVIVCIMGTLGVPLVVCLLHLPHRSQRLVIDVRGGGDWFVTCL